MTVLFIPRYMQKRYAPSYRYRFNEIKNKAQNDSIWIVGISGTQLSKNNKYFTADRIIYIAKITDVKTFCEYFSDISEKKKR